MKKAILFILMISSLQARYWTSNKDVAYEGIALVESFNMKYMTDEEKELLKNKISEVDALYRGIDTKDHFFLTKISIYKWLLKNQPNITIPSSFKLEDFKSKSKKEDLPPFQRWMLTALRTDSLRLMQTPAYIENNISTKLKKRISLIRPWLYMFHSEDSTQVELRMLKYHFSILDQVISQLKAFTKFQSKEIPMGSKTLSFFELSNRESPKIKDKTLSIVDEIIEKHKEANLPIPTNDWSISDEDSWIPNKKGELSKLQQRNVTNPEPNKLYEAPSKLPEPIDDWVWD